MPRTNARELVLEILRQAGPNGLGKTKLFKAFYFAHVYYAKERPERLTDWPIARMPQGPGIHNHGELLGGMQRDGSVTVELVSEGPYREYRYRVADVAAGQGLDGAALAAVREAASYCMDKTAAQLSEITHEYSRAWNGARDGDVIDVTLDAIEPGEYEEREQGLRRLDAMLTNILGASKA